MTNWICPGSSQTFFWPLVTDEGPPEFARVRVEALSPDLADPLPPPPIAGVLETIRYDDAQRSTAVEALAYPLLPQSATYVWPAGAAGGGLESGAGLIGLPLLERARDAGEASTLVAMSNLVPVPGFTDFALYIFDQNGLVDYICLKLNEGETEYLNLSSAGYFNPGFRGSAVISASFWEHWVLNDRSEPVRNVVGLAAAAWHRAAMRPATDQGDVVEAVPITGRFVPLSQSCASFPPRPVAR
jgi:hypothetical protein